jgi:hypothetical protein
MVGNHSNNETTGKRDRQLITPPPLKRVKQRESGETDQVENSGISFRDKWHRTRNIDLEIQKGSSKFKRLNKLKKAHKWIEIQVGSYIYIYIEYDAESALHSMEINQNLPLY